MGHPSQQDWDNMGAWLKPERVDEFSEKYGFRVALIHIRSRNVIFWLLSNPQWRLAFFDKNAAVLIHSSVVPEMSKQALDQDVSTNRYLELRNPEQMLNLFNFYVNIVPYLDRKCVISTNGISRTCIGAKMSNWVLWIKPLRINSKWKPPPVANLWWKRRQ